MAHQIVVANSNFFSKAVAGVDEMLRNESLELAQRCSQKAQLMLHVFPVQQSSLSDVPKQRAILGICSQPCDSYQTWNI